MIPQLPQPVHLLGVALPQNASLPYGEGGIVTDGPVDGKAQILQRVHLPDLPQLLAGEGVQQLLEPGQQRRAVAELPQIPSAGGAVNTAAHQALDIVDFPQGQHQFTPGHRLPQQLSHRGVAALDGQHREERPLHPGAQHPCAHRGAGLVQHPEEAAPLFPAAQGFGQLQAAAGGPIQLHIAPAVEHVQAADVAEVEFLGLGDVAQQGSHGADRLVCLSQAGFIHVPEAKVLAEGGGCRHIFKEIGGRLQHGVQLLAQELPDGPLLQRANGEHRLPGGEAAQLVEDMAHGIGGEGGTAEFPGGHVAEGNAAPVSVEGRRADIIAAPLLQHGALGDGAGRDDADHVPLHQALCQSGVLHLLADGHLVALGDQPSDVRLGAVVGDAAHGCALLRILHVAVAGGQRQIQLPGGELGVVVEHLIKIAQAEKQQAVLVLLLDLQILPLHGRQFSHRKPPVFVISGQWPVVSSLCVLATDH